MAKNFPKQNFILFFVPIIKFAESLPSFHSSNNIGISYIGWRCSMHGRKRKGFRVSVGKSERTRSLQRPTGREENNIKMYIKKI
jgi:hypothetical protein